MKLTSPAPFLLVPFCAALVFWMGCAPGTSVRTRIPEPPPLLDKTYGEIKIAPQEEVHLAYKNMRFSVDPHGSGPEEFRLRADYLLVSNKKAAENLKNVAGLRPDQKIVTSLQLEPLIKQAGFRNAKGLQDGQRLLLQKDNGHAFLSFAAMGPEDNGAFFLEFDSGRNVLLGGPLENADQARPFLYRIRDEGKAIHLAALNGRRLDEGAKGKIDLASEILALLQPQVGVIYATNAPDDFERVAFEANEANLFFGRMEFAEERKSYSF